VVEDGNGRDVDALGHLGAMVAQQLSAEQAPAGAIAGDAQVQLVGAWVVGLVVELDRPDRDRVEAGLAGVGVAQAGAGHGQLEDLGDLGAKGAGEGRGSAEGGLAGDSALLVGGAERQVGGLVEEAMVGLDAVAGGQDVGEVGAHAPVDPDGPADAGLRAGGHGQVGAGADPDHHQDEVGGRGEVGLAGHGQPPWCRGGWP
jgi:hypothetical protein